MDFSRIARQLSEDESRETAAMSSEKAKNAVLTTKEKNRMAKMDQKDGMAQQRSTVYKSDVSYASEEARLDREMDKNYDRLHSDWRKDLTEAMAPGIEGDHPYVDVMPFLDQKAKEARRQAMAAMKSSSEDGHHQGGEGDKSPKMEQVIPNKERHSETKEKIKTRRQDTQRRGHGNPHKSGHTYLKDTKHNRQVNEEESAMDKAMALMRDKYKGAIIDSNKKKQEMSDEERRRRERERARKRSANFSKGGPMYKDDKPRRGESD